MVRRTCENHLLVGVECDREPPERARDGIDGIGWEAGADL